jgi:hypothetical protein
MAPIPLKKLGYEPARALSRFHFEKGGTPPEAITTALRAAWVRFVARSAIPFVSKVRKTAL